MEMKMDWDKKKKNKNAFARACVLVFLVIFLFCQSKLRKMEWQNDPISCSLLENPYLASDGITYSLETLKLAVQADPWHRSPVTGEVLRNLCFPNTLIMHLMDSSAGKKREKQASSVSLFDPLLDSLPENGGEITWVLPSLCTPQIAAFKMKWKLEDKYVDKPLALTARILRDSSGIDWLMHPPPPEEIWEDVIEIAKVFNVQRAVPNPWCLSSAKLGSKTVEMQILLARGFSSERSRPKVEQKRRDRKPAF